MKRSAGIFYREQGSPSRVRDYRDQQPLGVPRDDASVDSYEGMVSWVTPMTGAPYVTEVSPDRSPSYGLVISPTMHNPGSAKVIPSGYGFVNKSASRVASRHMQRVAATIDELFQGISPNVMNGASEVTVTSVKQLKDGVTYQARARGGSGKSYLLKITLSPLQITCSCPFWQWQGPEHWASQGGYLYGSPRGTASAPTVQDSSGDKLLCKHAVKCLQDLRDSED